MKRTFATFAAVTALALGACGAPAEDEAAATSTVTQHVTAEEATKAPAETQSPNDAPADTEAAEATGTGTPPVEATQTPDEPEQPEQPEQTLEEFQQVMHQEMVSNGNIGDTFTIDGQPTELCVHGDGYGLNVVTAGENTTCDFARSVMNAATAGLNPTGQNVRDSLPASVHAGSPATGEAYDMQCTNDERNLITCTGGSNAVVYMY